MSSIKSLGLGSADLGVLNVTVLERRTKAGANPRAPNLVIRSQTFANELKGVNEIYHFS